MSIDSTALSTAAQQLFNAAMRLPDAEREKLADRLYLSVEANAGDESANDFEATIARRVAEIENGTAKLYTWDEFQQTIREARDAARKL